MIILNVSSFPDIENLFALLFSYYNLINVTNYAKLLINWDVCEFLLNLTNILLTPELKEGLPHKWGYVSFKFIF